MQYHIEGQPMPVVICEMAPGEAMVTEKGSMCWMSPNMQMETFGGGLGRALGRMFSGESIFLNRYTAQGGPGMIAFASSFPGDILPFVIGPGQELIVQKSGFLAAETGVDLSIHFSKRFAGGLFGGEGFILQRLSGNGVAFVEFDGHIVTYDLRAGETVVVSTGHLAAMTASCTMDVVGVPGVKNALLGGEGLFNTVVTGPGRVWLQTMPVSSMAGALRPFLPSGS